jgi:hypothetical protein
VNSEEQFQKMIKMLENSDCQLGLVNECLRIKNDEITFSSFHDTSTKTSTEHIFDVYKHRNKMAKELYPENNFVIGYEELLPSIEKSELEYINVSNITSEFGTYLIFSDYEYSNFVGILKSKRNLTEVRERMKGSEFYHENKFKNGILILTD